MPHVQPPGGLPNYYRENVTGGPGSFVLEVHDFHTFGEAMTRKLVTEIAATRAPAPLASGRGTVIATAAAHAVARAGHLPGEGQGTTWAC